jgi:poly-beta-1,6-N-acetyl-D-glucosamine synthase
MSSKAQNSYVLVTAAYNEEKLIERVLESIVGQTILPRQWIVVSDGSTDQTNSIVESFAARHPFIRLLTLKRVHQRNFGAQVDAITEGCRHLKPLQYEYIGNVDADVSFPPGYFADMLERFERDPRLGLAGGFIAEEHDGVFVPRKRNNIYSVPHAVQLFRRECFESIGGYVPLKFGGPDSYAGIVARMKGWRVQSFPELSVRHHRPSGTADTWTRDCFRQGCMDFSLGAHPIFEIIKCIRRISDKPRLVGSVTRLSGFAWCYLTGQPREVSDEFMDFLRRQQMNRVYSLCLPWRHKSDANGSSKVSLKA